MPASSSSSTPWGVGTTRRTTSAPRPPCSAAGPSTTHIASDSIPAGTRTDRHRCWVGRLPGRPVRAIADGEALLGHLARHPATARHLAAKLARRFVHDDPPASLVERLAAIYLRHDTALVPVLAHLFTSPEFDDAFGAKFRRPIEFAAEVLRVTGAVVDTADPKTRTALDWRLRQMGQQPFDWPAPDGYPDVAASWLSPNDVLGRWNLSSVVAGGNLPGVTIDQRSIVEPTIGSSVADAASHVLRKLLPGSPVEPALVSALVEASGLAADDAVTAGDRRRVELMVAVALASFPAQVR